MRNILLVTDAWHPQVNGVVTTLTNLVNQAKKNGDRIYVYHPNRCKIRFPLPSYREITIGIPNPIQVRSLLNRERWDHIHIATPEGPLGFTFSSICEMMDKPFSMSCHTKFPEYIHVKFPFIPTGVGWKIMKWMYKGSNPILTTTDSMVRELKTKGFTQTIIPWTRGVDRSVFYPSTEIRDDKPILLCVSRVSEEKGIDDFCSLKMPNTRKILVGDGPYLKTLKQKYPDVEFVGRKLGKDLGDYYRMASVFVFPSKTDTFGVVNIEALACGTPVAAYPITGPIDIIESGVNGFLSNDLQSAIEKSLTLNRNKVYESSLKWSWESCYNQFVEILIPIDTTHE